MLACHPDCYIWLNKRRNYGSLVAGVGPIVVVSSSFFGDVAYSKMEILERSNCAVDADESILWP